MTCFRPLPACRSREGRVRIGYDWGDGYPLELPCGRCIGCKLDRARAWSIRIGHEAQLYDANVFATLTYAPECLPESLSLEYDDFQKFMKRLRKRLNGVNRLPDGSRPVRFFCAGEYGGETGRPHWHAILFNTRFGDEQTLVNETKRSGLCDDLWDRGNVVLGDVNAQSAAYVAGYTLKKRYGAAAAEHYEDVVNLRTGELTSRRPEFVTMSRRPGIGARWYERYGGDLFPHDFAVQEGKQFKVPRYYWKRFQDTGDAKVVEEVAYERELRALDRVEDSTPSRLEVREILAERRSTFFGERGL